MKYYETYKWLFDSSNKSSKNNPKYASYKERILKTLPENLESNSAQADFSFYELKICNIATIRIGKALIDDLKNALEKVKLTQDSIIKLYFDGGCSGLNSTVNEIIIK